MKTSQSVWRGFLDAIGAAVYIGLVSWLLSKGEQWFGGKPDNFFMPVFMILLFVISATVTSLLVLGKPAMMYHDGQKKEAFALLGWTIGWLVLCVIAAGVLITVY